MNEIERACWCGSTTAAVRGSWCAVRGEIQANSADCTNHELVLVQCAGCSVLALHPQPTDAELAAVYSREYYGGSRRKFIAPVAAIIGMFQDGRARRVAKLIPSGGRILDVGCGNGGFLIQMKRRGFRIEGTEWTARSAARVPPDAAIPVHVGDLIDIPLPTGAFDAITLWHVFEHLRWPRETLEKIRTLLKPGGGEEGAVLIMSMPNAESPQAERYGTHWFHHDPPRHLFGFGPHSITLLLEESGFNVRRISTRSFEQNPFGEVQSMLNTRIAQRDRLYALLKGAARPSLAAAIDDLVSLAAYAPYAVARDIIEGSRGEGATMTIEARLRT